MHELKNITLNQQVIKNNWREKLRVREETIRTWTTPSPESEGARIGTVRDQSTAKKLLFTVPLISLNALYQLHIFIFFLAVFHVIYNAITMTLRRLKVMMIQLFLSYLYIRSLLLFCSSTWCWISTYLFLTQIRGWKEWEQ